MSVPMTHHPAPPDSPPLLRGTLLAMKRAADVVMAGIGLVLAAPVVLVAALLVWLQDWQNPFFVQDRLGRRGQTFKIIKLRSMVINKAPTLELGQIDEDHPMVTRTGRWLRRLKIDELPQLWNVLRGDMSVVGPRPVVPDYLEGYDRFECRRLELRPGLTGWTQVNGSTKLSWEERNQLDVWYVDHWSFLLDLRILFRTVQVVLWGERRNEKAAQRARQYAADCSAEHDQGGHRD